LASCDLLVLDFHLIGNESGPALSIVRELARSDTPNLVVLYTADSYPDRVLISVAAAARGAASAILAKEIDPDFEELRIEWSISDLVSFFEGRRGWVPTYMAAAKKAGLQADLEVGAALLERELAKAFGAEATEEPQIIDKIRVAENRRWFQCGNLFLTVLSKPEEHDPETEADLLLGGLEEAVRDWAPEWLACLIALSRRAVEVGSFRDDALLPEPALQAGLLRYVHDGDGDEERARRAREIAAHLLSRRFQVAVGDMSGLLLARAKGYEEQADLGKRNAELLFLNAFLCSEAFTRHHLRVGSIFRREDSDDYWVCVTPACDMVPRTRSRDIDPWAFELDPARPMLALRLSVRRGAERALKFAEQGRYLFFRDQSTGGNEIVVAAAFNTATGDPNPQLEQMFAADRALVHEGRVVLQRCIREEESNVVALQAISCVVASQLRAPYAERLAHVVGGHLSRIGVNFLGLPEAAPAAE